MVDLVVPKYDRPVSGEYPHTTYPLSWSSSEKPVTTIYDSFVKKFDRGSSTGAPALV